MAHDIAHNSETKAKLGASDIALINQFNVGINALVEESMLELVEEFPDDKVNINSTFAKYNGYLIRHLFEKFRSIGEFVAMRTEGVARFEDAILLQQVRFELFKRGKYLDPLGEIPDPLRAVIGKVAQKQFESLVENGFLKAPSYSERIKSIDAIFESINSVAEILNQSKVDKFRAVISMVSSKFYPSIPANSRFNIAQLQTIFEQTLKITALLHTYEKTVPVSKAEFSYILNMFETEANLQLDPKSKELYDTCVSYIHENCFINYSEG